MDDQELELFRTTVRHAIESSHPDDLRSTFAELGWFEVLEAAPDVAVGVVFEEQGRSLGTSSMLDEVVLAELRRDIDSTEGRSIVLYPLPTSGAAPSSVVDERAGTVTARGLLLNAPRGDDVVVIPVGSPTGIAVFSTTLGDSEPVGGLDPDGGVRSIDTVVSVGDGQLTALAPGDWEVAVAAARRALAHELIGIADRMLELAVEHVTQRRQFGQPLGAFQAVQQRLADVYVALSAARAGTGASWDEDDPLVASMAKSLAATAHERAARECQQVMGGIGFTWEHPLHRYIKRGYARDILLGTARMLEREVGNQLISAGRVPRVPFGVERSIAS